jgi:glycosyltransferase involved in cell wall biosynthesis
MIKLNPLISVIIPTYKRNDFIQRAINSVLNQSYRNIEIIVVDDNDPGSIYREKTEKLIFELQDNYENIIYIQQGLNRGAPLARNTGVVNAKGDYIAFLDDDDYWLSNKVEEQLKYINDYDVILTRAKTINTAYCFREFNEDEIVSHDLIKRNCGGSTSGLLLKKEVITNNLFDHNLLKFQDWDLYIRLCQNHKIRYIREVLIVIDFNLNRGRISTNLLCKGINDYKPYHLFFDKHRDFFGEKMYKYHLANLYMDGFGLRKDKISYFIEVIRLHGLYYPSMVLFDKLVSRL